MAELLKAAKKVRRTAELVLSGLEMHGSLPHLGQMSPI